MGKIDMKNVGFNESLAAQAGKYENLYPGRVLSQSRDLFRIVTAKGELLAEPAGKLRASTIYPVVGDFVLLDRETAANGYGKIEQLLPRRSAFVRKIAGKESREQVVAANIDRIFICMALNQDFNVRRLERYLGIVWDSGAVPIIVLTKADLCEDLAARLSETNAVAIGAEVLVTAGLIGEGLSAIEEQLAMGRTIAFLGSSGVGKTTLINSLSGSSKLATGVVRSDGKGRHTTTRRELLVLPGRGVVIDTPGMRELGIEHADLGRAFDDIERMARQCRFKDCQHDEEPGCAVWQAIKTGQLDEARLFNYKKMQRELSYAGLSARQRETEKLNTMFASFGGMKNIRKFQRKKK